MPIYRAVRFARCSMCVFLWALTTPSAVFAQAPTIPANTPFQVEATHDGVNTATYSLRIDGVEKQVKPVTALTNGKVVLDAPGLAAGTHTVTVAAINQFGASESSPASVAAGTPPTAPGNLRIITVTVTVQSKD